MPIPQGTRAPHKLERRYCSCVMGGEADNTFFLKLETCHFITLQTSANTRAAHESPMASQSTPAAERNRKSAI